MTERTDSLIGMLSGGLWLLKQLTELAKFLQTRITRASKFRSFDRLHSRDSRHYGPVPRRAILRRVDAA